ncbi:hypothetical protein DVA85_28275 [Acinetobacter sp. RIT592]|nr:hypothetical protein DVA85_28275 [Acinetobacter sp. RIT592]
MYSSDINIGFLILSVITFGVLILMNRRNIDKVTPYMMVGMVLWIFIYYSGIHATISGVLIAIAIPSKKIIASKQPMMYRLEHKLAPLCNLVILPLFALANTAINLNIDIDFNSTNTLITGIVMGLVVGKPLGIMLFTWLGTKLNITEKPEGIEWADIIPVSLLAGIGFTMSIFVSEIAFVGNGELVNICKISILSASIVSIVATYLVSSMIYLYKQKTDRVIEAKSA